MTPDFIVPEKAILQRSGMGELYVIDTDTGDKHIAASRRADGSIRKSIKVRPGFMPLDEQRRYKAGCGQSVVDKFPVPSKPQRQTIVIPGLLTDTNSSTQKNFLSSKNEPIFSPSNKGTKSCTSVLDLQDKDTLGKKRRPKKKSLQKMTIQYVIEEPTIEEPAFTTFNNKSIDIKGTSIDGLSVNKRQDESPNGDIVSNSRSVDSGRKYESITDRGKLESALQQVKKKITESKRLQKHKEESNRDLLPNQEEKLKKLAVYESDLMELQHRLSVWNLGTQ